MWRSAFSANMLRQHRGRAALQRRVKHQEESRALAPEVLLSSHAWHIHNNHWLNLIAKFRSGCVISPHNFCRFSFNAELSGSLRNASAIHRYDVGRSRGVHSPAEYNTPSELIAFTFECSACGRSILIPRSQSCFTPRP